MSISIAMPNFTYPSTVSVIIRTKDRKAMLAGAITSVIEQTYRPIELVIVNDGGVDVERALEALIKPHDISFQYICNDAATGRAHAANQGLNAGSGEFSLFLDDDDLLEPDHISTLVSLHKTHFERNDIGISHCVAKAVHFNDHGESKLLSLQGEACDHQKLLYQNKLPIMTALFNTKARDFAQFDENFDLFEDWDFWLQVSRKCKLAFTNHASCLYRIHQEASDVRSCEHSHQAYIQIYKKWLPSLPKDDLADLLTSSHQWHAEFIDTLQRNNQCALQEIGTLHEKALQTIHEKDADINKLSELHQQALDVIAKKDEDVAHLSALHKEALDVIAHKDAEARHLNNLYHEAIEVIHKKDIDSNELAKLYDEAVNYIGQLESSLQGTDNLLNNTNEELKTLKAKTSEQRALLKRPWYWHLFQSLKRTKH